MTQLERLDALISAATAAREAARRDNLFGSFQGLVLLNAAYDIFECDGIYDMADVVRRDLGLFDGDDYDAWNNEQNRRHHGSLDWQEAAE